MKAKQSRKQNLITAASIAAVFIVILILSYFSFVSSPRQTSDEILVTRLSDQDEDTRLKAATELAKRKNPAAFSPLTNILNSESWVNRRDAVEALGQLGDTRATPYLLELLDDSDTTVQETAATVLVELGDQAVVEPLVQALHDKAPAERWSVAVAFSKIVDERAIPDLIEAVNSPDIVSHHEDNLTRALANQGEKVIQPLLESMMNGGNGAWMLANIEKTTLMKIAPLHDAITNRDLKLLSISYPFFINLDQDYDFDGIDETLSEAEQKVLAEALLAYGDKDMAQIFANFRGDKLFASTFLPEAASKWAEQHGYTLVLKKR